MENLLMPYTAVDRIAAESALVFAPHPDDEVFGCGGAILRSIQAGIPVQVIVVSNGAYGPTNEEEKQKYIEIRRQESLAAAEILGYGSPIFWNYEDRGITYCEQLIEEILAAIKRYKADLVYTPSLLEMHPDHRSLAMAVLEAARRSDTDLQIAMYEAGMPMRPNTLLDITPVWELKRKAMACVTSQLKIQAYDAHITGLNRYRTYTLGKEVEYAEAYFLVSSRDLQRDFFAIYASEYERQAELPIPLLAMNENWPKVSVLIRSMDRPELQKALDSIALQTHGNLEVIVVNAKGPGHRTLSKRCGRFPIRFIDSDTPLRRAKAANLALEHATGDYLIFLDDDDLFLPDHIYTLVAALLSQPDKKVAYTKVQCIDAADNRLERIFDSPFDRLLLLAGNYIPIHAAMFSRELLKAGCKMDEAFDLYEDWDLWIQASQHTDFIFIPKITAYYRISDTSGLGIQPNSLEMHEMRQKIFQKWQQRWTQDKDVIPVKIADMQQYSEQLQEVQNDNSTILSKNKFNNVKVGVVLHLFYEDLWPEIQSYLNNIPIPFDLFITTTVDKLSTVKTLVNASYPDAQLIPLENRGRDILPFLTVLPELIRRNYTCVCKIHTKHSAHDGIDGAFWRRDLFTTLLGNSDFVKNIITYFNNNAQVGMAGPEQHYISCAMYPDINMKHLAESAERLLPNITKRDWCFFAGSMFWFKPSALLPLLQLGFTHEDFEPEEGQKEGTLAHIVERLFTISTKAAGLEIVTIDKNNLINKTYAIDYPFTIQSTFLILNAWQQSEKLITTLLKTIDGFNEQLQQTENALKFAENLAIERLNQLQQTENALKFAENLAIERLNQLQQTENALKFAENLATERLKEIEILTKKLHTIKQQKFWKICTKLKILKDI